MYPSELGKLITHELENLPDRYNQLVLDQYVLMPNHLHFNLFIYNKLSAEMLGIYSDAKLPVSTIPMVIGGFKAGVTRQYRKHIRNLHYAVWQRSFWDRVIRNDQELEYTREYICNNVQSWHLDRENTQATGKNERFAMLEEGAMNGSPTGFS